MLSNNQANFDKLLSTNACLDEYSQIDEKLVSDKMDHLDEIIHVLYIYTWTFLALVWMPISTPVLFCIAYKYVNTRVQLERDRERSLTYIANLAQDSASEANDGESQSNSLSSQARYNRLAINQSTANS